MPGSQHQFNSHIFWLYKLCRAVENHVWALPGHEWKQSQEAELWQEKMESSLEFLVLSKACNRYFLHWESSAVALHTPGCSLLSQISRLEGSTADLPSKGQALTLSGLSSPKIISMVEMTKRWAWLWEAAPSQLWHSQGDQHQGLTWIPQPTSTRVFRFLNQGYIHSSTKVKPQQFHIQGSWFLSQCHHCG